MQWTTCATLVWLLACGEAAATIDAGPLVDGGAQPVDGGARPVDASGRDAATASSDASSNVDGRVLLDASTSIDGGATTTDAGQPSVRGPWRVYVNVGGERRLAVVDVEIDGSMTEQSGMSIRFGDVTGAMAHDPVQNRLYVGLSPTGLRDDLPERGRGAVSRRHDGRRSARLSLGFPRRALPAFRVLQQ